MEKVVSLCRLTISQDRDVKMKKFFWAGIYIWIAVGIGLLVLLGIGIVWSVIDVISG